MNKCTDDFKNEIVEFEGYDSQKEGIGPLRLFL